jgi:hypothetical protein
MAPRVRFVFSTEPVAHGRPPELALALSDMIRSGEVSRARAEEIATMVLRTNAGRLYKLELK